MDAKWAEILNTLPGMQVAAASAYLRERDMKMQIIQGPPVIAKFIPDIVHVHVVDKIVRNVLDKPIPTREYLKQFPLKLMKQYGKSLGIRVRERYEGVDISTLKPNNNEIYVILNHNEVPIKVL